MYNKSFFFFSFESLHFHSSYEVIKVPGTSTTVWRRSKRTERRKRTGIGRGSHGDTALHAWLLRPLISDLFSDGAAEVTAGRLKQPTQLWKQAPCSAMNLIGVLLLLLFSAQLTVQEDSGPPNGHWLTAGGACLLWIETTAAKTIKSKVLWLSGGPAGQRFVRALSAG